MGNRAVIITKNGIDEQGKIKPDAVGIYLHWNGGRDSVEAFLDYCDALGYRSPKTDETYAIAQLARIIGNFFENGLSVGVGTAKNLDCDNWDNGVYVIDGWEIAGRLFFSGKEQNEYDRKGMMLSISERQPKKARLTENMIDEYLTSEELPFH